MAIAVLAAGALGALGTSPAVAAPTQETINTRDRQSVVDSYRTRLEPLLAVPTGWTGDVKQCRAGTIAPSSRRATLGAVNYVRALAGLPSVSMDAAKSRKAQAAALIMAANGYLSHQPTRSASCWSEAGYQGASHGNLFLGWGYGTDGLSPATGARAVVGYMDDDGGNNVLVGHRRWILYQQQRTIGTGDTDISNSLYVIGQDRRPSTQKWVSWPTAGYFPWELEPAGRWSLSYPGADFSRAEVKVTTPEGRVKVRQYPVRNGYGDNTVSWDMALPGGPEEPTSIEDTTVSGPRADLPVTVTVSGIRQGGRTVTKKWTTTLIEASSPDGSPEPVTQ